MKFENCHLQALSVWNCLKLIVSERVNHHCPTVSHKVYLLSNHVIVTILSCSWTTCCVGVDQWVMFRTWEQEVAGWTSGLASMLLKDWWLSLWQDSYLSVSAVHCFDGGLCGKAASGLERILCWALVKRTPGKDEYVHWQNSPALFEYIPNKLISYLEKVGIKDKLTFCRPFCCTPLCT